MFYLLQRLIGFQKKLLCQLSTLLKILTFLLEQFPISYFCLDKLLLYLTFIFFMLFLNFSQPIFQSKVNLLQLFSFQYILNLHQLLKLHISNIPLTNPFLKQLINLAIFSNINPQLLIFISQLSSSFFHLQQLFIKMFLTILIFNDLKCI